MEGSKNFAIAHERDPIAQTSHTEFIGPPNPHLIAVHTARAPKNLSCHRQDRD